jgi:hypothetical protein
MDITLNKVIIITFIISPAAIIKGIIIPDKYRDLIEV